MDVEENLSIQFWLYGVNAQSRPYRYLCQGDPRKLRDQTQKNAMVISGSYEELEDDYFDQRGTQFEKKRLTSNSLKHQGKDFITLIDRDTDQFVEGTFRWCKV